MEFDELIDVPHFAKEQNKLAMVKFWRIYFTIVGVVLTIMGVPLSIVDLGGSTDLTMIGYAMSFLGVTIFLLSVRGGKLSKKRKADLEARVNAYYTQERNRRAKVKENMTAAEWENYKLQVQNQRLLRELNSKSSQRTTTTTWTTELSE